MKTSAKQKVDIMNEQKSFTVISGQEESPKPGFNPKRIDWMVTLVPFALIVLACGMFFAFPEKSNEVLTGIRNFLGDSFGLYYLLIGLGTAILSIYIACSRYGKIVLGAPDEKPKYSFFVWGSMMFTAGLAADI